MLQPIQELFKQETFPDLLVGLDRADDAAVYRLNESQAIITTTDFFPPVVDDPYDFGAVAAANAMSDVYAMGGEVLFAMNLVAFPPNLDRDILRQIIRGGAEKVAEAGAVVVGGHSLEDKEPKYGLAVTGLIDPQFVKRKGDARPGDRLLLTKPLGTGVVTTALKEGVADAEHVKAAVESMKTLNRDAARAALTHKASGMTDITGFGLLGHAQEMARQADVNFSLELSQLQWLPGAEAYGEMGTFPGGMGRNMEYFSQWTTFAGDIPTGLQDLLWTPETSGGLLIALAPDAITSFQEQCPSAFVIGTVTQGTGRIQVVP